MIRRSLRALAVALCLVGALSVDCSASEPGASDAGKLEGVWSGAWGLLIEPDGTVHQPVHAELFIQGDRVEWTGFPGVSKLTGTIRVDPVAKQIRVTPAAEAGAGRASNIVYGYQLKGDALTLTDGDKQSIPFTQVRVNPLAGVRVEFLEAMGMDDGGDLVVTDFEVHRAGRSGPSANSLGRRPLKMKHAAVFLTQENGVRKASLDEVRRQIREPTPVVVAFRPDDRPSPLTSYQRWQETDSEAVGRTLARFLRPGTLVVVVPEGAAVAPPP